MLYEPGLGRQMLTYFADYATNEFPTFSDFAEKIGASSAELCSFRRTYPDFAAAWDECRERQKSRLIRGALTKRFDPTFAKFLLTEEFGVGEESADNVFSVRVEVID